MVNRLGYVLCYRGVENDEEFFVKPPEGSGSEVNLPQSGTEGSSPMNSLPSAELMLIQRECQRMPPFVETFRTSKWSGYSSGGEDVGVGSKS